MIIQTNKTISTHGELEFIAPTHKEVVKFSSIISQRSSGLIRANIFSDAYGSKKCCAH